jgi:hypothetical protein
MESDSVRAMGDSTVVDLWINGKFRAITVSRQAIESYLRLPPHDALAMTDTDRREFVRTHLALVVSAATARLSDDPGAEALLIERLEEATRPTGDRRRGGDRRKGERRKVNLGPPGGVERRR